MTNQLQLGLLVLALAAIAYFISRALVKKSGLPDGKVVYSDNDALQSLPKPLYDRDLILTGKPDYIISLEDGSVVPVEYKSQKAPALPYDSHILQLSAYCYLCEKSFGRKPAYGLIRYADKTFQIDYNEKREGELRQVIAEIRHCEANLEAPARSHSHPIRCRGCGYHAICDQRF